jgi:hypothetical protein
MKKRYQYSIISFLSLFLLLTVQINQAHAGLPVVDLPNLPQQIIQTIFGSQSAASAGKTLAGTLLQKSLKRISSQVALNMTQQIINWGSTGFNGNPFFVRDQSSFFKSIADQKVESFVNEITGDITKFPYSQGVAKNLITSYLATNSSVFADKSKFTLDKVIGPNWQDFTDGDFAVGGWDGWMAFTQNDANNPVGSYLRTAEELENRAKEAQGTIQNELNQSGGFLSAKKCVEYKNGSSGQSAITATDWTYTAVNDNLQPYTVGPFTTKTECQSDSTSNPNATSECVSSGTNANDYLNSLSLSLGSSIQFDASDDCSRYETVTPGKLVADQLNQSVTAPLEKALLDSASGSPVVDAVSNLAAGLISKGLSQLIGSIATGSGDETVEGPGDNSAFVSDTSGTFSWNVADAVPLEGTAPGTPSSELLDAINKTQTELTILTASRDLLKTFPIRTMQLDQCLPGPDYKYASRMQSEFTTESRKLESKSDNNTNNGEQAQDQLKYLNNAMSYILANFQTNILIKNITSAAAIVDQVKKVEEYNQDQSNLQNKISDKVRSLALLKSIVAGIAAHPKPSDGSPDSASVAQYKNQLAGQYVVLKDKISRSDTISDAQNECNGYVADLAYAFKVNGEDVNALYKKCSSDPAHYTPGTTISEPSLQQACMVEKNSTNPIVKEAVGKDAAQLLFCGTDANHDADPLAEPGWQWIFSEIPFVYHAGEGGGYTYTKGYNNEPFKMECNKFYHSSISDYLPQNY